MSGNFKMLFSAFTLLSTTTIATTILVASIFINSFTSITSAQTKNDSTEVLAQIEKYKSIWNTHDAASLAEFFTSDADFIMGNLPLINGREGIQNWWQNYFNTQEPERKLAIAVNSLRIITPDVALINIGTITGGRDYQGKELINRKARGTWVLIKQNGNWLIIAMRGMPTEEDKIIRNIDN